MLRERVRVYDELAVNNGISQWVQRAFVVRKEEPLEVAVDIVAIDLRADLASFSATEDSELEQKTHEKNVLLFRLWVGLDIQQNPNAIRLLAHPKAGSARQKALKSCSNVETYSWVSSFSISFVPKLTG